MSLAMSSDSILSTLSRSFMSKVLNFVKSIVPCKQYLHFQPYMLQKNTERYQHYVNYIIMKKWGCAISPRLLASLRCQGNLLDWFGAPVAIVNTWQYCFTLDLVLFGLIVPTLQFWIPRSLFYFRPKQFIEVLTIYLENHGKVFLIGTKYVLFVQTIFLLPKGLHHQKYETSIFVEQSSTYKASKPLISSFCFFSLPNTLGMSFFKLEMM